jgi:uncharacterized caspase-like protein
VQTFVTKASGADLALFYYAGHGVQFDGSNYLVPVDMRIDGAYTLQRKAVPAQVVLEQMERAAKVSLVFLDACRNNTLMRVLEHALPEQTRSLATARGLARMEPKGSNSLIAFATAPNTVAADGVGRNSPFTAALLKHIDAEGVVLQEMLIDVTADVVRATDGKQKPEVLSRLTSKVWLKPKLAAVVVPPPPALPPPPSTSTDNKSRTRRLGGLGHLEIHLRP